MNEITVKEICEKLWTIEKDNDLFNKKVNGVYFWKLIRNQLFHILANKLDLFDRAHSQSSKNMIDNLIYISKIIKNQYLYGAIKRHTKKDILIFESSRKKKIGSEYMDIYTFYLQSEFQKNRYEIIESDYNRKHYKSSSKLRSYNDHFSLVDFLKYKVFKIKFSQKEKKLIRKINILLERAFEISDIDLQLIIKNKISNFHYQFKYYDKLFRKRSPNLIYLVCSYGKEAMISACRKNNIKSIEIQHGTINKYHLGYSFPNDKKIPYFPDQLNMFGEYWYESTPIPLKKEEIKIIGYPFMKDRLKEYKNKNLKRKEKQVLFISQGTVGYHLSKYAYEFAISNRDAYIIYKLHPGEQKKWKKEYPYLLKASKLNNFEIINSNSIDLYKLFFESEYLVGVYSTAIFEGLVIGCKIILINLPGIEYMDYLIKHHYVELANTIKELNNIYKKTKTNEFEKDFFFKFIED